MRDVERLGARHLDRAARGSAVDAFAARGAHATVRIVVGPDAADTVAGQHLAWMTANLVARLYGVVTTIDIVAPCAGVAPGVAPFGAASDLAAALQATAGVVGAGVIVPTGGERPSGRADVAVVIGSAEPGDAGDVIAVAGRGWNCALARGPQQLVVAGADDDPNPVGPYLGACAATGEAFKSSLGIRAAPARLVDELRLSGWDWSARTYSGPEFSILDIKDLYLIGAGAVGQALAAVLIAARVTGHIVIVDDDVIDETNLNRYVLATIAELGTYKTALLERLLAHAGIGVTAYPGRWPDYADDLARPERPQRIVDLEADYRYEQMISAVDRNEDRHAIQKYWPRQLIGASTNGLSIEFSDYDMAGPYECLMCGNPVRRRATLEEVEAALRQLSDPELRAAALARGVDADRLRAHLDEPRCGHLNQVEVSRFRDADLAADYAVSFASAAAGVGAASQVLRRAIEGTTALEGDAGATARLSLLTGTFGRTRHLRRDGCSCSGEGAATYHDLWG